MPIETARKQYQELRFDTLPLLPGSKIAYARGFPNRSVNSLWKNAPENANIGIRGGGSAHVAFFDADEYKRPGTFENIIRLLAGLGYSTDFPIVQTASGIGRHVYVTLTDSLPGNARILAKDFGVGEFRYGPGAYVVAPPSVIKNFAYTLISGDFRQLPSIAYTDVLPILGNQEINSPSKPNISRRAAAMIKGDIPDQYKGDRSDAEQGLMLSLVNAGYTFPQVEDLFNNNPCAGHYEKLCREKGSKEGHRYLDLTYKQAVVYSHRESPIRQAILEMIEWAQNRPWSGRTGAYTQSAYIALLNLAYNAGRLEIAASCRDIAELGGMHKNTAANALYRLSHSEELLRLEQKWQGQLANRYRLVDNANLVHSQSTSPVRECTTFATYEAFRRGKGRNGLGPAAGQIYQALQRKPATIKELALLTGRDPRTVKANLANMRRIVDRKSGEVIRMVEINRETWKALPCDLDIVAEIVGTKGATERQKKQHAEERREHADSLKDGR
jgi:hypothetical protein